MCPQCLEQNWMSYEHSKCSLISWLAGFSAIFICTGPTPNCQLSSWVGITRWRRSASPLGAWRWAGLDCLLEKSTWGRGSGSRSGKHTVRAKEMRDEQEDGIRAWGEWVRYQEGCVKLRFQQSQLIVFCHLGGRGLGPKYKLGQEG